MGSDSFSLYDGSEYDVVERPAGPKDPLVMRFHLPDRCASPPLHTHPHCRETFAVERGLLEMRLGDDWQAVMAGESVTVEPETPHTFRNESGGPVVVRNTHDPHHDFERYLRQLAALTHEYRTTAPRSPAAAAKAALVLTGYPDLIRPADPAMKFGLPAVATIAKVLRVSAPEPV